MKSCEKGHILVLMQNISFIKKKKIFFLQTKSLFISLPQVGNKASLASKAKLLTKHNYLFKFFFMIEGK